MLFSPVYIESHPRRSPNSFLGLTPTCPEQTRGIYHSPSPILLPTDHRSSTSVVERRSRPGRDPVGVTAHYRFNSFSCNIYGSPRKCCKQKTYGVAKPFRCNIYKKHGVRVPVMVNQISDEEICPEEYGDEGPLLASARHSWLERRALSASPGPAGTVNLLRAVPLNSRLLPLIGRSLRTGPGRLSKASFQLSAFDCEPLPWRSSQHSHICYSGGPTMITSAPLLPQNARRKRKPTP